MIGLFAISLALLFTSVQAARSSAPPASKQATPQTNPESGAILDILEKRCQDLETKLKDGREIIKKLAEENANIVAESNIIKALNQWYEKNLQEASRMKMVKSDNHQESKMQIDLMFQEILHQHDELSRLASSSEELTAEVKSMQITIDNLNNLIKCRDVEITRLSVENEELKKIHD